MASALAEAREELLAQNDNLVEQVRAAEHARGEVRAILDATSDAIILVGPDRVFRSINRQFGDLLGIDPLARSAQRFGDNTALLDQILENAEALRARLAGTASDTTTEFEQRVKQHWPACRDLVLLSRAVHLRRRRVPRAPLRLPRRHPRGPPGRAAPPA